jgi:long-chain acyl-CoA synthetase
MGNTSSSTGAVAFTLPGTGTEGVETPTWRNIACQERNQGELIASHWPGVGTLHDAFVRGVEEHQHNPCFGVRSVGEDGKTRGEYEWEDYKSVFAKVKDIASALRRIDLNPGMSVALFSTNRPEWIIAMEACYAQSLVTVPIYETLAEKSVVHILNESEVRAVVCTADKVDKLMRNQDKFEYLKYIIALDYVPGASSEEVSVQPPKINILTWDQVLKLGAAMPFAFTAPKSSDVATICYTSGSTSEPKGCLLSHANLLASVSGSLNSGVNIAPTDVYISYLPLAHMYERLVIETALASGSAVGFYSGELVTLLDDVTTLRPTLFASVPRIFNKLCERILQSVQASGGFYQSLFDTAFESKRGNLKKNSVNKSYVWDTLVFSQVKARLGGRIRVILSGSAPLQPEIHDFLKVTMSCPVIQGYGLTETCAASNLQHISDQRSGNVGPPTASCEMKLVSCPEMGYVVSSNPPRGEVCLRGPSIFVGYYKQDERTREVIDSDGWFHTGDIGAIDETGNLSIIDRKKNIFKLSHGEYVAVEKVENALLSDSYVSQIFVYGDSNQSVLVAIVVPNLQAVRALIARESHKIDSLLIGPSGQASDSAICENMQVKAMILNHLTRTGQGKGLQGFELIKNIFLEISPFTIENDLLSSTLKLKRPNLKDRYAAVIADLYTEYHDMIVKVPKQKDKKSEETSSSSSSDATPSSGKDEAQVPLESDAEGTSSSRRVTIVSDK